MGSSVLALAACGNARGTSSIDGRFGRPGGIETRWKQGPNSIGSLVDSVAAFPDDAYSGNHRYQAIGVDVPSRDLGHCWFERRPTAMDGLGSNSCLERARRGSSRACILDSMWLSGSVGMGPVLARWALLVVLSISGWVGVHYGWSGSGNIRTTLDHSAVLDAVLNGERPIFRWEQEWHFALPIFSGISSACAVLVVGTRIFAWLYLVVFSISNHGTWERWIALPFCRGAILAWSWLWA